jgi:hypothetical protein
MLRLQNTLLISASCKGKSTTSQHHSQRLRGKHEQRSTEAKRPAWLLEAWTYHLEDSTDGAR